MLFGLIGSLADWQYYKIISILNINKLIKHGKSS